MAIDPASIGLAFAEFVFQNYAKIKPIAGAKRADMLTEMGAKYPEYDSYFIEFFSDNDVFDMFKKLQKGQDFEELLEVFQGYCATKDIGINTKEILDEIKNKVEFFEADTNIEKISLRYLQQIPPKLDDMHSDIKDIKSTLDSQSVATTKPLSKEKISDYVHELTSKLESTPSEKFEISFSTNDDKKPIHELIGWAKSVRKAILQGVAGGGKTMMVETTVQKLCEDGIIPVLISLEEWHTDYAKEMESCSGDVSAQMDILLKMSVGTINVEELASIEKERWIIVDGLNEISAGEGEKVTRMILDVVGEYSRKHISGTCMVTDRDSPRNYPSTWSVASLGTLSVDEVRKHVDAKFGTGKFDELEKSEQQLFFVPLYLKIALDKETPSLGSEAMVLKDSFKDQLGFDDDDLDKLSVAAFMAYKEYGSRKFVLEKFKEWAGEDLCQKLLTNGIIKNDEKKGASFEHQLKHDYLVSRYLASNEDIWTLESFEISSLQSNSLESLTMVLEQLVVSDSVDKFLEAVYDWNWYAAIDCTVRATKMGARGPSKEMEMMMLALAAQKIFDNVYKTSTSAKIFVKKFGTQTANDLLNCSNIEDVCTQVKSGDLSGEKFVEWKEFFTRNRQSDMFKEDIDMIKKSSLMGWTAANILKEFDLDDSLQKRLRTIYELFDNNNPHENTVRWRVVHTLGAFDSKDNLDLLLCALDKDPYLWAKYGAARSLVEMAANTSDESLRKSILDNLASRTSLPKKVLEEIGRAVNRKDPPTGWMEQVLPLLENYSHIDTSKDYVDEWKKIIEDFKEERWKNKE